MVQSHYFSNKLVKGQIDRVLNNYGITYITLKSEIDKNVMLYLFLKDICTFLERIDQVTNDKDKINDYDRLYKEKELLSVNNNNRKECSYKHVKRGE